MKGTSVKINAVAMDANHATIIPHRRYPLYALGEGDDDPKDGVVIATDGDPIVLLLPSSTNA